VRIKTEHSLGGSGARLETIEARRTLRVAEIVRLFGHAAGGLPSEKLPARLPMLVSDNAILRQLKRLVRERADPAPLRAIAIDDWSWRKGFTYGTIVVDMVRQAVADVLDARSAKETAGWLARRIAKWFEADSLPDRRRLTLKPSSQLYFQDFLARRWAEGDKIGRRLFHDVRHRGYTPSRSQLERVLSEWRGMERPETSRWREPTREDRTIDPATGWQISPVVTTALCMKPTLMLTDPQVAKVAVLKETSPSFVVMRGLAMRFCDLASLYPSENGLKKSRRAS
jgi:hypothetical protein